MGVAVAEKKKVLLVGGMDYNIPRQIKEFFDVIKHVTQGSKFQTLPKAELVLVVTEWAGHNLVEAVKAQVDAPIVPLVRGGWEAIKQDLIRRSILPPEEKPLEEEARSGGEKPAQESLFSSMTETEVWKKYGPAIIEAAQGALKPKEVVSEDDVLEALSLSGVPKEDCRVYLPKLQMKGILDPVAAGKWRLMAAPGFEFENERVKVDGEEDEEEASKGDLKGRAANGSFGRDPLTGRRQVRSPELLAKIAGLPKGPYGSKRAIFEEMRKYSTFDGLSDWQVGKYIDRAIEAKIIDDTHESIYVNNDPSIVLTRSKEIVAEPEPPEKIMAATAPAPVDQAYKAFLDSKAKKIEKTEAEKAWCYVVEDIKKERERLAGVLVHCRIEWMGDNKVLVIFIPAVLAQWQKFVESTENWGLISRKIQERLPKDTAIRFMVDNGLRA